MCTFAAAFLLKGFPFTFVISFTTIYTHGRVAEWQTRTAQDRMDESP